MRILRLRLRNYRGIVDREIVPAVRGVTVVTGPNEIGKSSLAEAIDLLFDELDSTTKQRVRNVQPADRDAGAEIEIDVETGPYAFTYAKRFQRRAATRLTVTRPRVENLTGRDAHRRAREILDETIDTDLWHALRVQQGDGLSQASWLGRPALAAALDRAAGCADGAREQTLYDAAEAEVARYFTKTGRERREQSGAGRELAHARQSHDVAREALAQLEQDVQRAAALRVRRTLLEAAVRETEQALREQERAFEPIDGLREALSTATARCDAAQAEEREATQALRQRSQLLTAQAAAEADVAQRSEEIESGEPGLLGARAELEHAERAVQNARAALDAAASAAAARQADLAFLRAQGELAELRKCQQRVAAARAEALEARQELDQLPIDAAAVREIRDAERAVERAQDRVEAEGPLVQVTPHAALRASLDGRTLELGEGETLERRVTEALLLSVPGVADVTVIAGAGSAARVKTLEEARTRWRHCCAARGVDDHAGAVTALAARREAERRLAESERRERELLGGEPEARLTSRIEALEATALSHTGDRDAAAPPPRDDAEAAGRIRAADTALEDARRACLATEQRRDGLLERHRQLAEHHRETAVRQELAEQSFREQEGRLGRARAERSDEELAREREARGVRARLASQEAREAAQRLAEAAPEQAEARLSRARSEREDRARELAALREEAAHVAARLELRGEAGLYDQLEETAAELERREREALGLQRRARAAKLLLDTLREERERARQGYAAPLARRIEQLGRGVFGESFRVELDDELRVARRIQAGISLPFDQLSGGAREQVALLVRLAVATLVGDEGGAPLILDDALGHSDPERLASVGRTLASAAPDCQILVLTCTPERYRHVENAHVVTLA